MLFIQFLACAMGAAALSVTAPAQGSSIPQSGDLAITWAAVSSDSQSFNIQLALSTDSGNAQTLTSNVSPSTNGYSTPASAFSPGNYTVNLVGNTATSSGVLAQSRWFLITAAAVSSSASATSAAAASTLPATAASSIAARASAASTAVGSASAQVSGASASGSAATESSAAASIAIASKSSADKVAVSIAGFVIAAFAAFLV